MPPSGTTPYQSYQQQPSGLKKNITIIVIILVACATAYTLFSAIKLRNTTGVLRVSSPAAAQLSLELSNGSPKQIGKGNADIRLKPGQYQITATEKDSKTTATVEIIKKQTISVSLSITQPSKTSVLANYTAQNIFIADGHFYFLNTPFQLLNSYQPGDANPETYFGDTAYPVDEVSWITATDFYADSVVPEGTNAWQLYMGGRPIRQISYLQEGMVPNSISFNSLGAAAFTTNQHSVILIDSPSSQPRKIGSTKTTNTQTSIAPDGTVLVSTPNINYGDKTEPTTIYRGGSATQLPTALTGIANVVWAPGSQKFAYSTNQGLYIYDLGTKNISQIYTGSPTNVLSPVWVDDDSLVYAQNQTVWRYLQSQGQSHKQTAISGILNTMRPFVMDKGGLYYGTSQDSNGNGGNIYKLLLE